MANAEASASAPPVDALPVKDLGPLIFISHDSRDAALAEAFSKLLGSVTAGMLKTFRSSDKKGSQGFEYGVEWYPELMKTLESACDVICLLTERGLGRPWMLYEAGVAKGKLDIPVHGLALGVPLAKASVGPFAQFQNCGDDVGSITKLVVQLVQRLPHADPDLDTVRTQVEGFKAKAEELLVVPPNDDDENDDAVSGEASPAKLFEEIKVMFQDLPSRMEMAVLEDPRGPRRLRRFHPEMLEETIEIFLRSGGRARPTLLILIAASIFRDDIPWLYEIAAEGYRASRVSEPEAEQHAIEDFFHLCEVASRSPSVRGSRMGKDLQMLLHDMPRVLTRYIGPPSIPDELKM